MDDHDKIIGAAASVGLAAFYDLSHDRFDIRDTITGETLFHVTSFFAHDKDFHFIRGWFECEKYRILRNLPLESHESGLILGDACGFID